MGRITNQILGVNVEMCSHSSRSLTKEHKYNAKSYSESVISGSKRKKRRKKQIIQATGGLRNDHSHRYRAVCAKIGELSDRAPEVGTTESKMPQGELKAFPCPTFAPDFDIVSWEESIS